MLNRLNPIIRYFVPLVIPDIIPAPKGRVCSLELLLLKSYPFQFFLAHAIEQLLELFGLFLVQSLQLAFPHDA